jgi:glycosyltransferase involved in cell wall biosynthesis
MRVAGHEVAVMIARGGYIDRRLAVDVARYHGHFSGAADPRGLWGLSRTIRDYRPDWLIGSLSKEYWPVTLLGRRHRVPVALFKHTATVMRRGSRRWLPRLAQRFIVISEYMRTYYIEQGIPAGYIQVLHNPFDTEVFRRDNDARRRIREQLGLSEDDVVTGFVGGFTHGKGITVLAQALNEAMKVLPQLHGLWVGRGPEEPDVRKVIGTGGTKSRHHFVGWADDARPYYSAMDMFALPSIGTETFGRVCVEAEACGVPALGSRLGGIPEAIQDGVTGRLLPPGDVAAWRDAILELARDDALRKKMGEAGPAFVAANFGATAVARAFEDLLREDAAP